MVSNKTYSKYSKVIKFDELESPDAQWVLLESIGEGTYGEVFKAQNIQTSQLAAVKVINFVDEVVEEIEEEYQILKNLSNHPNLPTFFGIYMKKVKGENQLWLGGFFGRRPSPGELKIQF
jgi:myosin-3